MAKKSLREVVTATRQIPLDGEDYIEVRGLSLADLTELFRKHTTVLTNKFDDVMAARQAGVAGIDMDVVQTIVEDALVEAPSLVGDLIACAMDEPENAADAAKLRAGVQIQALMAIAELSITTEAELKKVLGVVTTLINTVTALIVKGQNSQKRL